ncbi:MAG: hypothetical protein M3N19_02130 [Candidatus Eremiobacteraeota bacterium]|nr:hypothetical protein [Candidatus Eremiobacteraeota bacterium]
MAIAALFFCCAALPRHEHSAAGTFLITTPGGPYISGGPIALQTSGTSALVTFSVIGPGSINDNSYQTPQLAEPTSATIVASTPFAYAIRELRLVPAPKRNRSLIAVAAYNGGISLHSPVDFSLIGIVPMAGAPGDVAIAKNGDLYAPATNATTLVSVSRAPWTVSTVNDVPFGNEVLYDEDQRAVFISNRDVNGKGALTRIIDGKTDRVVTGVTAEGLALDETRHRIYVGNVNDGTVLELDSRTLLPVRRIPAVTRPFGIALDAVHQKLFVVSNQDTEMRRGGGFIAKIDLAPAETRIEMRSKDIPFPVGIVLDSRTQTLFVTDEGGAIYILDARTLAQRHAPLAACAVPWKPHLDERMRRLYVPCARANKVAVYNVDTLRQLRGSPFSTGTYPLAVATSNQ